ncbi:3-methyl-2-oxobutanoate hydroxymethyltransferase, partial [Bradyrhizobium sp. CAR08]
MSHISEPPVERVTIPVLQGWKEEGRRIAMTTAYDAVTARIADPIMDVILVGDSVANVCLGFDDTLPVSMAMMNHHLEAVVRTKPRALLVADMPFLSF